jgi:hypothetical protein
MSFLSRITWKKYPLILLEMCFPNHGGGEGFVEIWFFTIILKNCPMFSSNISGSSELILDTNAIAIYGASNAQSLSKCPSGWLLEMTILGDGMNIKQSDCEVTPWLSPDVKF